jgi:hypothetical protein
MKNDKTDLLNDLLSKFSEKHDGHEDITFTDDEINELIVASKMGLHLTKEWCQLDDDVYDDTPIEICYLKAIMRQTLLSVVNKHRTVGYTSVALDMIIEAAYNFGKSKKK